MAKTEEKMKENMQSSVHSIYSQLLAKRQQERDERNARREAGRIESAKDEDAHNKEENTKMTKKERREAEAENWREVITSLTGDDLEYKSKKKNKKKYRKWIDDDNPNTVLTAKPKKVKKKNYNKEFEADLNMLRTFVSEQNKFNADLWKRWNLLMGPAAKDGQVPTKTMIDMAAALNAGRSNSLSMLNSITNIKKTIADLQMKQKKLDSELGGTGITDTNDLALIGSSIGASMLGDNAPSIMPAQNPYQESNNIMQPIPQQNSSPTQPQYSSNSANPSMPAVKAEAFDPSSWNGIASVSSTIYEAIPHSIVVEKSNSSGEMRFKAIRNDNGEELVGCPVPSSDISRLSINEKDGFVKGQFDEVYKIQEVD